jgi:hypothetical protein
MRTKLTLSLALAVVSLAQAAEPQMAVVEHQDVSGQVLKRLGLPSQQYCWEECLQDARCTGTRWAVIAGSEAGQCQLMSGELSLIELHSMKTEDGQPIVVTASRKVSATRKP